MRSMLVYNNNNMYNILYISYYHTSQGCVIALRIFMGIIVLVIISNNYNKRLNILFPRTSLGRR
jgi:hypothetical protein